MKPDPGPVKPAYWDKARRALMRRDPIMGAIIRAHPKVFLVSRGEPFNTLARAICGQQISVKAAQAVWNRLLTCCGEMTPEKVLARKRTELRGCGLSDRKTEYIADLAQHFADGKIHPHRWPQMSDEEIIDELVDVRGIGRWTAEMFLMFNQLRPDVFPLDDLGLQKGIRLSYRKKTLKQMKALGETWRPWRSVATWYLWRSLDPIAVDY
jgi:DNA-3-methyladenine glycosylase II